MAVLEACAVMRREQDPLLRAVAVFAVAAIVAELMVAYGDLQLESYRNLVLLGALIGAVGGLPHLDVHGSTVRVGGSRQPRLGHPAHRRWASPVAGSGQSAASSGRDD